MAPRTVKTSHGEPIGPLQAAELLRARRIAKGKAALTPEEEAQEAARQAGQPSDADALPLGRVLASTEKRTRDGAIRSLAAFLSRPSSSGSSSSSVPSSSSSTALIPPAEMAKLWKGIFYCFWMSDKPLVQQALATELADLVLLIAKPAQGKKRTSEAEAAVDSGRVNSALAFLQGFWSAMAREWPLIDKHRVDKYYLLMRRFTGAGFRLCQLTNWDSAVVAQLNEILVMASPPSVLNATAASPDDEASPFASGGPGPLAVHDLRHPDSISYHVADIWVDELSKAVESAESSPSDRALPLSDLLEPIYTALARSTLPKMYDRILENSLRRALDDVENTIQLLDIVAGDNDDEDEDAETTKAAAKTKATEQGEEGDFDLDELWVSLHHGSLIQGAIAFDLAGEESEEDEEAEPSAPPAKRAKTGKNGSASETAPSPSLATLMSRARQLRIDIFLALRAAARAASPPTHPARARALEKFVRQNLSPSEDPEPQPADAEGVLSPEERAKRERKWRMERAKARLLRKKRNVEMQAAIQRKAAARRANKAKVAAKKREAAKKARMGLDGPVVIGPALSRKVSSGKRKK
ncbi:hypothetical protein OC834_000821 [Tilletia horrida]|nr:hypothetical protein OC834_000821 [Tilletia horrida]